MVLIRERISIAIYVNPFKQQSEFQSSCRSLLIQLGDSKREDIACSV